MGRHRTTLILFHVTTFQTLKENYHVLPGPSLLPVNCPHFLFYMTCSKSYPLAETSHKMHPSAFSDCLELKKVHSKGLVSVQHSAHWWTAPKRRATAVECFISSGRGQENELWDCGDTPCPVYRHWHHGLLSIRLPELDQSYWSLDSTKGKILELQIPWHSQAMVNKASFKLDLLPLISVGVLMKTPAQPGVAWPGCEYNPSTWKWTLYPRENFFYKNYLDSTQRGQKSIAYIATLSNNNPQVMC